MEQPYDYHSRVVYVDKDLKRGVVELPPGFFEYTGMDPGNHVVVNHGGKLVKTRSKQNDLLKHNEVGISPKLSSMLGLNDGDEVGIEDRSTLGDRVFDEVEELGETLEHAAGAVVERIEETGKRVEEKVEKVLDQVRDEPIPGTEREYIQVEPSPTEVVEAPPMDPTEDISDQVKVWTPDPDGDGTVPIFKPEQDEDDEDLD